MATSINIIMKILGSEITPYNLYINRRKFIKSSIATGIISGLSFKALSQHEKKINNYDSFLDEKDKLNTYEEIKNYNNFYEFGMGKEDPANYSSDFNPRPWSLRIEGLVNKPQVIDQRFYCHKLILKIEFIGYVA